MAALLSAPRTARPVASGGRARAASLTQRRMGCVTVPRRRTLPIVAVADLTEAQWEQEVLQSDVPVLVDFWAPWCGPCKLVAPLMNWAEQEHAGALKVVKVEHDKNKGLVERYKVYGLPTFIVFKDGQEVPGSKSEGAVGKAALAEYIRKFALAGASVSA